MIEPMKALILTAVLLWIGLGLYFGYKAFKHESAEMPPPSTRPSLSAPASPPPTDPALLEDYKKGAVKNTILKNRKALVDCYNAYTNSKPKKVSGAIVVDWVIEDQGTVTRLGIVSDALGDATLKQCITTTMSSWLFPPIPGTRPVYIEHTFNFGEPPKPSVPEMVNVKPKP